MAVLDFVRARVASAQLGAASGEAVQRVIVTMSHTGRTRQRARPYAAERQQTSAGRVVRAAVGCHRLGSSAE